MYVHALSAAISADQARGCVPIMVVATAGTTNAGMIDPLGPCAQIARNAGLWNHVDAAWGGALIASDRLRGALAGIEQADSITIAAHKWLATTMGCGMFMTRHASMLSSVFHVSTTFMPSNIINLDPYVTTAQWSRRFLGLRLFLSLATAGWHGYAEHVERSIDLMALLREKLAAAGWMIANDSALAVLCIEPPSGWGEVRALVARVTASGQAWVAAATLEGRDIVRVCLPHGEASEEDILALVKALNARD
jgi:glutamate/tyrosine decarboxylase-like PLP-dependent enzyme